MQTNERWEFIYNQINGINESDVCEWVKDESSPEGEIGPLTDQIYEARNRICDRTGLNPDSDPDLELLFSGFEKLSRVCGKLMYHYGRQDQATNI